MASQWCLLLSLLMGVLLPTPDTPIRLTPDTGTLTCAPTQALVAPENPTVLMSDTYEYTQNAKPMSSGTGRAKVCSVVTQCHWMSDHA